ncbi:DMP19 family protein [Kineococcus sp. G2]|uniref:DMP19 family protein n=1 Tax=Kineococcus sp. G2 TaxID=3127484 RepID=UPI00301D0D9E
MTDEEFDALWNRACEWDAPAIKTHRGDEALHVALTFHGSVMNGGLLNAVETYAEDPEYPLPRVLQAYRFLGLDAVASIIERARQEYEEVVGADGQMHEDVPEERIDASYPLDDDALSVAARAAVEASPNSFAPRS